MIDRRLLLLGLPAGALSLYLVMGVISPAEIQFTRVAPAAPASLDMRPAVSTAYLELPLDLGRIAARIEAVVAQRLAATDTTGTANPACVRRPNATDCAIRPETQIEPAGPVRFEIHTGGVKLKVPVRISEFITGSDASRSTPANITFSFAVRHRDGTGFEITRLDDTAFDGAAPASTPAIQRALRQAETRLRPAALAAHDDLRQLLAALPVSEATQQAWGALSTPLELGKGSNVWLRPIPELVGSGQIVAVDGQARFRIPMAARLSIDEKDRGPLAPQRPAIHGEILTQAGSSIRIATNLPLGDMQRAANTVLAKAGQFEMKTDRFGPPLRVSIHNTRAYSAVRQIAFELDITATRFEGEPLRGKAHLVGRPQLDVGARLVSLADIALTPATVHEATAGKPYQNVPRLTAEPIASRLADAARIDLTRDLSEAVPRYSGLLHQRLNDSLSLSAHVEQAVPVGVETTRDGAWLIADLAGTLTLTYDRGATSAVAAIAQQRAFDTPDQRVFDTTQQRVFDTTPRQSGRISSPEVVSAAVMSATAGAAATISARQNAALPPPATPMQASTGTAAGGTAVTATAARSPQPTSASPHVKPTAANRPAGVGAPPNEGSDAARRSIGTVRTKVLATKPKASSNAKVATSGKSNWIPFAQ